MKEDIVLKMIHMLMDLYIYMCKDLSNRHQKTENYYLSNPHLVYDFIYN